MKTTGFFFALVLLFFGVTNVWAEGINVKAEAPVSYQTGSGLSVGGAGRLGYEAFLGTSASDSNALIDSNGQAGLVMGVQANGGALVPVNRTGKNDYVPDVATGVGKYYVGVAAGDFNQSHLSGISTFVIEGGYTRNLGMGNIGTGHGALGHEGAVKVGRNNDIGSFAFQIQNLLEMGQQHMRTDAVEDGDAKYFFVNWRAGLGIEPCLNTSTSNRFCLHLGTGWRLGFPMAAIEGDATLKFEQNLGDTAKIYVQGSATGQAQAVGLISEAGFDTRTNGTYTGALGVEFE